MANLSKDKWIHLILNNKGEYETHKSEAAGVIDLSEVELLSYEISDVNLNNIDFTGSTFAETQFTNVNFSDSDFTSCDFTRCRFVECDFTNTVLYGADFSYAEVHYCNFQDADMAGAILNEANLEESDLVLSENLSACRFDEGTIWPDSDKLPEDFDSSYSYDLSSLKDDEEEQNSDYMY
ncbi:MAG: pentapeptide repeat-containing protein [bacterium]|nr:pentapeptide repeat-containing protein [bacterium]